LHLQLNVMENSLKKPSLVLLIISILIILVSSCKKNDKNTLRVEGKVFDPNTNEYVQGVTVVLSASKLSSGGIFSSGYVDIATMTTDASGTFACEFKEDKYSGYRIYISKAHYFDYIKELTTSDIVAGTTFSPTYNLYTECFIWMEVHNLIPQDINDHITYGFSSGTTEGYGCCDNTYYQGYGMAFNDTVICKTHGNQNVTLTYNVTKGGSTIQHTITRYCNAFDTTRFVANY
jgi:hypothetical protein